jgi:hypothetical protein
LRDTKTVTTNMGLFLDEQGLVLRDLRRFRRSGFGAISEFAPSLG